MILSVIRYQKINFKNKKKIKNLFNKTFKKSFERVFAFLVCKVQIQHIMSTNQLQNIIDYDYVSFHSSLALMWTPFFFSYKLNVEESHIQKISKHNKCFYPDSPTFILIWRQKKGLLLKPKTFDLNSQHSAY